MNQPVVLLPESLRPVETPLFRLGNEYDGGYVISKIGLEHSNHLLSFGLGSDWTFEVDFLKRKTDQPGFGGIDAWDPTLSGWFLTKRTARYFWRRLRQRNVTNMGTWYSYRSFFGREQVRHHRTWIERHTGPERPVLFGRNHPTCDLANCMSLASDNAMVYLKIDIESSEYGIMNQIVDFSHRVAGISIEYHEFGESYLQHRELFDALNERFHVVHLHANNFDGIDVNNRPRVIEVSYVSKKLLTQAKTSTSPLPDDKLDRPNNRRALDYRIQFEPSCAADYRAAG